DYTRESAAACVRRDRHARPHERPRSAARPRAARAALPRLDRQPREGRAHLRGALEERHARRHARAGARADRPRHRRRHAAGNRRQHPRGADRGETRQRRSAPATLDPSAARARTKSEVRSLRPVASLLVRGGTIVTMNDRFDVVHGDVSIKDGRIAALGSNIADRHDRVVDARGGYILPGLIQTHLHLCQTLFRGYADDLPLMDWLRSRVWPMEAAHTPASLRAAARLATTELLAGGTTAVLTMETVHD